LVIVLALYAGAAYVLFPNRFDEQSLPPPTHHAEIMMPDKPFLRVHSFGANGEPIGWAG
jgi:hypothetical protein